MLVHEDENGYSWRVLSRDKKIVPRNGGAQRREISLWRGSIAFNGEWLSAGKKTWAKERATAGAFMRHRRSLSERFGRE